ncbi:MAG: hypothetical protein GTO55_04415 [Armatimonadetes bacterium]|nr:hypothetical protein [Armatimonadota bacterium]NIM23512.1 hypothetical protein [Armatimonadota bacterium]NIM67378.1 hypothetical protein [Armatimonadota bacterium]NIM75879.1 hypothetical protein [Armatimonadota bacterium]NIN05564.1 hypothetical protein [Armatimonadota bacterium]
MSAEPKIKDLSPSNKVLHAKMLSGLEGRVSEEDVNSFVKKVTSVGAPAISAKASVIQALIYGNVTCDPKDKPWKFDESIWGIGAAGGSSIGVMYTAYESWDPFFTNTRAFHVQGIASGGGILQITWFDGKGIPIGQFNGAMAGAGGIEGGGKASWKRK